jgi:integrase
MLLDCSNDDEELKRFLLLAIETGARRSELTSLEWKDVDLTGGTLTFRQTKNGTDRTIPLTGTAKSTLESMPKHHSLVFSLSSSQVTRKFSKACSRAQISDLRLHDLRHEAISRFFEAGLNQIEVAAISGHKSITMLHRYTHISTAHLLKKFITSNLTES